MPDDNKFAETVYRNQKKRYPWWVKSVDQVTIELDHEHTERPMIQNTAALFGRDVFRENYGEFIKAFPDIGLKLHLGADRMIEAYRQKWAKARESIFHEVPGHTHRDQALMYAAYSLYYDLLSNLDEFTEKTSFVNICKRTGANAWQGSKLKASDMIEKAGKALGASQIGFAEVNPLYLYVRKDKEYPPEMKYVIVILTEWSPEGIKRADTAIGTMANRVQAFREQNAVWGLRNFIRGLGYREEVFAAPWPAYGVSSGLGEIGRMNRLVSPIYRAAVNVYCLVTDLPLAVDKPIDFGLQEFCKRCKKCAKTCPVGAVSMADEPTWKTKGIWNVPGKKVYYENGVLCGEYQFKQDTSCSICLGACPWTKQDITVLHKISKAMSAKFPWAAKFMVFMDDLFGYGTTKEPKKLEAWWKMDLPPLGINTMRRH